MDSQGWAISAEERKKHDTQFFQLSPSGGFLTGAQARDFFLQSGLPQDVLGKIWGLADVTADGRMDRKEFSIAMYLIKRRLLGANLPPSLPPSLLADPSLKATTLPHNTHLGSTQVTPGYAPVPPQPVGRYTTVPVAPAGQMMGGMPGGGFPGGTVGSQPQGFSTSVPAHRSGSFVGGAPAAPVDTGGDWGIPQAAKLRYKQVFNREDKKRLGYLSGFDAKHILIQSGLTEAALAQIWTLSDIDGDGRLTTEEFCVCMYLIEMAKSGQALPMSLPPHLIPPSYRGGGTPSAGGVVGGAGSEMGAAAGFDRPRAASIKQGVAFNDLLSGSSLDPSLTTTAASAAAPIPVEELLPSPTLEDKRRENFTKGAQELERRRAELQAQQRAEEEKRLAKERDIQEKRAAVQREQDRKRQQELERMATLQREAEQRKEEERREAMEARDAARKDQERQRQLQWERQRKEQLEGEKKRQQEFLGNIQSQVGNLKYQLETLDHKKVDVEQRIVEAKVSVTTHTDRIDGMRRKRDDKMATIQIRSIEKKELQDRLAIITQDHGKIAAEHTQKKSLTPVRDALKTARHALAQKKEQVEAKRRELAEKERVANSKSIEYNESTVGLQDLKKKEVELKASLVELTRLVRDKKTQWAAEKDRKKREEERKRVEEEAEKVRRSKDSRGAIEEVRTKALQAASQFDTARGTASPAADKWSAFPSNGSPVSGQAPPPAAGQAPPPAADDTFTTKGGPGWTSGLFNDAAPASSYGASAGSTPRASSTASNDLWGADAGGGSNAFGGSTAFGDAGPSVIAGNGENNLWGDNSVGSSSIVAGKDGFGASFDQSISWEGAKVEEIKQMSAAPEPVSTSTGRCVKYQALYDFAARNSDELNLTAQDIILVYEGDQENAEEGWLGGTRGDEKGWFPADYVTKIGDVVESPRIGSTSSPVSLPSGDNTDTSRASGFKAPSATVSPSHQASSATPSAGPGSGETTPRVDLQAVAEHSWVGKEDNHLSFEKGAVIRVTLQQDEWWSGELQGKEGWFPKTHVVVRGETEEPPPYKEMDVTATKADSSSSMPRPQISIDGSINSNSSQPTTPGAPGDLYVAMFKYESDESADLNFNQGDVITVTAMNGEWWTGSIGQRTGIFPATYAKKVDAKRSQKEIAMVLADYKATGPEQLSLVKGQVVQVRKKRESGWWEGELNAYKMKRQIGWFPANYVKLMLKAMAPASLSPGPGYESADSRSATPQLPSIKDIASVVPDKRGSASSPVTASEVLVALYDYTAQNNDELSLSRGDTITLTLKDNDDWWKGTLANGEEGMFPSNYVETKGLMDYRDSANMTPGERKRQSAISELMDTEDKYMADMHTAYDVFIKPLEKNALFTHAEMESVFVNWKDLIRCNRKLLRAMKVRTSRATEAGASIDIIGDILVENFPNMSPYIRYCSRQLIAGQILQEKFEKDPQIKQFFAMCSQNSRAHSHPISSFLLKPMQRITRYPLLIEKIVKHTPEDHPDRLNVEEALEKARELCNHVNEGVREKDNTDKLEWIQQHVLCEGLPEKIEFNSLTNCLGPRKFVYSGQLVKSRSGRSLFAFLFNDFLLLTMPIGSSAQDKLFKVEAKGNIFKMYRNPIILNEITCALPSPDSDPGATSSSAVHAAPAADTGSSSEDQLRFHISHIDYIIDIKAASLLERDQWVKRLQKSSENYLATERKNRERANTLLATTPGIGRLLVIVLEGCHLLPADESGKSDPYCEVNIGSTLKKTKVIQANLNPKWNTSMQFPVKSVEDDVLCITVYDQDIFSPNDFLGRTEIPVKDIQRENKQKRGPIMKRLRLQEVGQGEVVVKFDLQMYSDGPSLGGGMLSLPAYS